jgi:N-acetylmuramoyl-L-alanine amidase
MRALGLTVLMIGLAVAYVDPGLLFPGPTATDQQKSPNSAAKRTAVALPGTASPPSSADEGPLDSGTPFTPDLDLVWVKTAEVTQADGSTTFSLELSKGLTAEVFTLSNPYRVVIDMPEVVFALPAGTGQSGTGLIRAFRYGLFSEGQGRVVIDTTGPVRIAKAAMSPRTAADSQDVRFDIELRPMDATAFGTGTGAAATKKPDAKSAWAAKTDPVTEPAAKTNASRPIIMIDPGHGGIDPGAVGLSDVYEKNVVLQVSLALRDALQATNRYDVRLTRRKDVFLSLDQRVALSRDNQADLFISLHADSIAETAAAASIRGATVYTLSDRASDEQAHKMAEKENASDLLAGIAAPEAAGATDVSSILIDLMQRESSNFSTDFSNLLVRKLRKSITLARSPQRSAAFKVLKQTHAPAVLIELGYLTHPGDEKMLTSSAWQKRVAAAIRDAVDGYFSRRSALRGR